MSNPPVTPVRSEPLNPMYVLLLIVGFFFVMTAVAIAVIPVMEQKAREAGNPPPPSAFRDALRVDGWKWLIAEVVVLVVVSVLSMVWDSRRTLQNEKTVDTIPQKSITGDPPPPTSTS